MLKSTIDSSKSMVRVGTELAKKKTSVTLSISLVILKKFTKTVDLAFDEPEFASCLRIQKSVLSRSTEYCARVESVDRT